MAPEHVDSLISAGDVIDRIRGGGLGDYMIFEGESLKYLLRVLTADFAERLKRCTDGTSSDGSFRGVTDGTSSDGSFRGVTVTFHRKLVDLADNDNLIADGVADEAGVSFPAPDFAHLFEEPELPLPEDVIDHVRLSVAVARMGDPIPSDYELFKELEGQGKLGFGNLEHGLIRPDNMVVATCNKGVWTKPMAVPYSTLALSPNMQALHYGSAVFEGMTAEIGVDGNVYIFAMKEHYERYRKGAIRQGLDPVTYEMFHDAVITAVQQNARFMPKNGRMYIRPHSADIDPQMKVGNSKVFGFFVEVTPVGGVDAYLGARKNAEAGGDTPMRVLGIPDNRVRVGKWQGDVKAVGIYGPTTTVIKAVQALDVAEEGMRAIHPDGVLYLDRQVEGLDPKSSEFRSAMVCETHAANTIFIQNLADGCYRIVAPSLEHGDILPGNTRMLILEKAKEMGWEVEERDVTMGELMDGVFDSAFNCGTAAMITPFDAVHLLHIDEKTLEQDEDTSIPNVSAEPRGSFIKIRSQEAVNDEPTPKPVQILLKKLLAVKSGAAGDDDKERWLTKVPGLRAREKKMS